MRLLTWNSQGLNITGYENRLKARKPNVMVVQEAGNLGDIAANNPYDATDNDVRSLGKFRNTDYYHYWVPWTRKTPNGNIRCSLAIFSDAELTMLKVQRLVDDEDCQPRPLLWGVYKSKWAIANIHAGGNLYIQTAFTRICENHLDRVKIILGDFNKTPAELSRIQRPAALSKVASPKDATRPNSKKVIDYAVTSLNAAEASLPMPKYGASDHETVEINCP